jgi:hypothetical protein
MSRLVMLPVDELIAPQNSTKLQTISVFILRSPATTALYGVH